MVITCEHVWNSVSDYLDGDVTPELRAAIEEHLRGCRQCTAVVEGTRNVVQLYGDERLLEVPTGFSERMQQRINASVPASARPGLVRPRRSTVPEANTVWTRRGFLGWVSAAAATFLLAGVFEMNKSSRTSQVNLRSQHAQPAAGVPPDMPVIVSVAGKIFHRPGCTFILTPDNTRTLTASEAMRAGFSPCIRCMKKYLIQGVAPPSASA
jgi:anti-sigma factor RsiW